ncbi:MAG TPA: inositol monophosphatase family protein [Candidatus Saccharimonadales bacterium]
MNSRPIEVEDVLRTAAVAGACQLYERSLRAAHGGGGIEGKQKPDGTAVTLIDMAVEKRMGGILEDMLADSSLVPAIVGEEGTIAGPEGADYVVFFDPVDGTALVRLRAPGSTTGCSLYDSYGGEFLAGAVADPWLQRVVFNDRGATYQQQFNLSDGTLLGESKQCEVSEKSFADGGELLIEVVAQGFTRTVFGTGEKRSVLSQEEATRFSGDVHTKLGTKVRSLSSNLMHQLLVASGGDDTTAIATVMTAIGGPWDMSGVPLVEGARGTVLYVESGDKFAKTQDPMAADLVICANTKETAEQVYDVLAALR